MNRESLLDVFIFFIIFVICVAALFITKIIFLKNEKKLNKKLMLVGLIDAVLIYVFDVLEMYWEHDVVSIIFFALIGMCVKTVIIRHLLKISRKKSLILSIFSSLCVICGLWALLELDKIFIQAIYGGVLAVPILLIIRNIFGINDKISKETVIIVGIILGIVISLSCNYL